jgi:hypothetical protein
LFFDSAKIADAMISPGNKEEHVFPKNRFLGSLKFYKFELSAGIFKQSMGARNRGETQHSLTELVPWNQFLGSLKV